MASVTVLYFLPVRVLVAVMLTPGKGVVPDLTVPWIVPPACDGAVAGAGGCREVASVPGRLPRRLATG